MSQKYFLEKPKFGKILWHFIFLLVLFAILILVRLPILANADIYMSGDEGFMASDMADLYKGGAFSFYHDNVSYEGVFSSLFAIPFFMLFGVNSLAFKLPAALFYSLYIWSFFLLSRRIDNRLAWIVAILLVLCPSGILMLTTLNYSNVLIGFLANLAFLIFLKNRENPRPSNVFWIFFIMGISLYANTFSIIYITALITLWALGGWVTFKKISRNLKPSNTKEAFVKVIDFFQLLYFSGMLLTYVAGGIVLKANDFHILTFFMYWNQPHIGALNSKALYPLPFVEFILLALLRIVIYRQDLKKIFERIRTSTTFHIWGYGLVGFFVGLSPRWFGLIGKQVSGHAGFEVNIHPSGILHKIDDLLLIWLPKLFNLNFSENLIPSTLMSTLLLGSLIYFISNWIKTFRPGQLGPKEIFIILPLVLIVTLFIYQKPHTIRHLLPLYAAVVFGVAFCLYKIREKTVVGFIFLTTFWVGYYGYATYDHYRGKDIINGLSIVKKESSAYKIIDQIRKENIHVAYTSYSAHTLNFLSGGNPVFNEFYENALHGWARKKKSEAIKNFAVIITDDKYRRLYEQYLKESNITCDREYLNNFLIIFQCQGKPNKVNRLRSLVRWVW